MKLLLDFNTKLGREDVFKSILGNGSLQEMNQPAILLDVSGAERRKICLQLWNKSSTISKEFCLLGLVYHNLVHWKMNRLYGEKCLCHFCGWRISQARNQYEAGGKQLHPGFLCGIFFSAEDGGGIFLQNISWYSLNYTWCYIPKDITLHNHCQENLRSYMLLYQ
jgi:hypothetical protein